MHPENESLGDVDSQNVSEVRLRLAAVTLSPRNGIYEIRRVQPWSISHLCS